MSLPETTTIPTQSSAIRHTETRPRRPGEPSPGMQRAWNTMSLSSVGIEMAVAILLGWGIGHWLDGRLGTDPYLMLIFLGCGIAAAFKGLFRAAREARVSSGEDSAGGGAPRD